MMTAKILFPIALIAAAVTGISIYAIYKNAQDDPKEEKEKKDSSCNDNSFDDSDYDTLTDEEKWRIMDSIGY